MIVLAALFLLLTVRSASAVSQDVTATVRLSVCGDLVAEGSEECDNLDLRDQTCRSLGYFAGDLSCDIACEFDELGCYGTAPTPTPTPTPAPTPTPTPTPPPTPTTNHELTAITSTLAVIPTVEITQERVTAVPLLPTPIAIFDTNHDGKITQEELNSIIDVWIGEWVNFVTNLSTDRVVLEPLKCDVNQDQECDLVDLSVLLYHIL